jgi:hypothetical protein
MRLGQILVAQRIVTRTEVQTGLQRQRVRGGRLGSQLIAMGVLTLQQLGAALTSQRDVEAAITKSARFLQASQVQHGEMSPQAIQARLDLARASWPLAIPPMLSF